MKKQDISYIKMMLVILLVWNLLFSFFNFVKATDIISNIYGLKELIFEEQLALFIVFKAFGYIFVPNNKVSKLVKSFKKIDTDNKLSILLDYEICIMVSIAINTILFVLIMIFKAIL